MRNPLEELVGFQLVRTAGIGLRTVNAAYGDLAIRHPDAAVMMVIEANPGISQSAIGRMLKIQRSNMVPIISRLSDRGWIERNPGRGKAIGITVSPQGQAMMPQLHAASREGEARLAAGIGPDVYAQLLEVLRKIA
ncbi:MAG: MarR family winged helix-turn-helix transcriptional regulator [Novosphingobium sp.]|uniref:MarR family winged helix-turn-helix transcriptional regulator n=1 Tax=Novosphingobium sp. TaxID=1874826 RepID=UPI000BD0ACDA|nr:MarR family winged helix-turn-helix transcriptional regulator [Novosphingobium sp.]MDP3549920.1 MarR family winged helix-turn-helix transcriptional regulator [Novosphingobium sp.]OYZ97851.1 MAG: MarR family transcriptional regulator [Novosphingobium sp. 17-62-8]HQS68320.1 MarR family winged helix-turn-helix transcriptional regulator [Novosphingobium sp.]